MTGFIKDPELRLVVTLDLCPACVHRLLVMAECPMDFETVQKLPVLTQEDQAFSQEVHAALQCGVWRAVAHYALALQEDGLLSPEDADRACESLSFLRHPYPVIGPDGANISGKATGHLGHQWLGEHDQ